MNDKFSQHPSTILREDRLGFFTLTPFLPVHFHWTTTGETPPFEGDCFLCWKEYDGPTLGKDISGWFTDEPFLHKRVEVLSVTEYNFFPFLIR